jgi:hypothetical protein
MNNNKNYLFTKPDNIPVGKQLFSADCNKDGAKKFIITTFEDAYQIIQETRNLYEDHTFNNMIKLHIDIDYNKDFSSELARDNMTDEILENVIECVNNKLHEKFNIMNPRIIILQSDTLKKLSLHLIYVDVVFGSIVDMKFFFQNVSPLIDMNIYKRGCFRLLGCSKLNKNNELYHYASVNYNKPKNKFDFFLDTCVTHSTITETLTFYDNNITLKNPSGNKKIQFNSNERNYIYRNYDLTIITNVLEKINVDNYSSWLSVSFAIKDLWFGITNKKDQDLLYSIYDNMCKKSSNYNESNNYNIFHQLNPIIDINYLFALSETSFFIHPFYNYTNIIFNIDKYKNIIKQDTMYIDINVKDLIDHKMIFIKSPTGTGKTTLLKDMIKMLNNNKIISITSRVNLAGEHVKSLDLNFYKDLDSIDMKYCDNIVIQLESIWKCNYKLFRNGIIILDEVNSLLSHLRSPTFTNKRSDCYSYLMEIIKNASHIICMDADLSDWNIDFIKQITKSDDMVVYQNICKNKVNTIAEFYMCDMVMINIMMDSIKNNNYFVACFDSLTKMKQIIEYLSKFGKKDEWLIYSSEVAYDLIDTKTWTNKFVFFTPTILYGIDFNESPVDVFCFVHKFHLNPLQIYQMISRARQIKKAHIYCHTKLFYLKYKSVDDVITEFNMFEKNFTDMVNISDSKVDEAPYKTMYFNYKYMDSVLKTNIKEYLMDMMEKRGYSITINKTIVGNMYNNKTITKEVIKDRIVSLLNLNKDNLSDFEKKLVSNDRELEKHFNLRIFLKNNYEYKINESVSKNLFTETVKNKITKIKICSELMIVLEIDSLDKLTKDITKNFGKNVESVWLNENMETIKKVFDIRGKKYNNMNYYNVYMLMMTILKNLFDDDLFICKRVKVKKELFNHYIYNDNIMKNHQKVFDTIPDNINFID